MKLMKLEELTHLISVAIYFAMTKQTAPSIYPRNLRVQPFGPSVLPQSLGRITEMWEFTTIHGKQFGIHEGYTIHADLALILQTVAGSPHGVISMSRFGMRLAVRCDCQQCSLLSVLRS